MTIPLVDLATSGFILFAIIRRDKIEAFEDVCESFQELSRVFKRSRKLRRLT